MRITILNSLANVKLWFAGVLLQIAPVNDFIAKYLFADTGFLKWLVIVMSLDLLTGMGKVIKTDGLKGVTSRGLRDTILKCIQYGSFLIITHIITHYEVGGIPVASNMQWINKLAMEFILMIEVKSVYENITAINSKFDFVSVLWKKLVNYFPVKDNKDVK